MRLDSAARRVRAADRKDARQLLAMCVGLEITQVIDVLAWALHGRSQKGAGGIAAYTPTSPLELPDRYIKVCQDFAAKRGD